MDELTPAEFRNYRFLKLYTIEHERQPIVMFSLYWQEELIYNKAMKSVRPLRGCTGQFALRSNCRLWRRYEFMIGWLRIIREPS